MAVLPTGAPRAVHTSDSYREILGTGAPIIKPPPPSEMNVVVDAAYQVSGQERPLNDWIRDVTQHLEGRIPQERHRVAVMVSTDVFARAPIGRPPREQLFKLPEEYPSPDSAGRRIRRESHEKLVSLLSQVDDRILDEILPFESGPGHATGTAPAETRGHERDPTV